MTAWTQGTVVDRIDWNDRLFTLKVRADVQPFVAGQFTKLGLEQGGEQVQRAYSYVNSPDSDLLEFLAVNVDEGEVSPKLGDLSVGEHLMVGANPSGFLTLDEAAAGRELWMLATGTGVGPFLSILNSPDCWDKYERFILVYAVRDLADMAYIESLKKLQNDRPGQFYFIPIVSREEVEDMLSGRIPALIKSETLQKLVDIPIKPARSQIMICGNPQMIKDTIPVLEKIGLRKNLRRTPGQITVEKYW